MQPTGAYPARNAWDPGALPPLWRSISSSSTMSNIIAPGAEPCSQHVEGVPKQAKLCVSANMAEPESPKLSWPTSGSASVPAQISCHCQADRGTAAVAALHAFPVLIQQPTLPQVCSTLLLELDQVWAPSCSAACALPLLHAAAVAAAASSATTAAAACAEGLGTITSMWHSS